MRESQEVMKFLFAGELMIAMIPDVPTSSSDPATACPQTFATTHWSNVLAAKQGDWSVAGPALEKLCRTYWYPLYAFLRRQGRHPHDAQDLTQEFFARLLRRDFLEQVGPQKGKFRSFLIASLKNFLCDEWDKARAQKRGSGQAILSLTDQNAEELYSLEADPVASAEQLFERRWALTLLERALSSLRKEYAAAGKSAEFEHLKIFLSTPTSDGGYDKAAAALGVAVDTVGVKVYRLRQRYGELISAEIAQTVADPADIEEELHHLFNAVGG